MDVRILFETELTTRNVPFAVNTECGRHEVEVGGQKMLISLDNLEREVLQSDDPESVGRFVDSILASAEDEWKIWTADHLYWSLEPANNVEKGPYRSAISQRIGQELVYLNKKAGLITWVTGDRLESLGLSAVEAGKRALQNLARELREATIEFHDIDGVRLGFITSRLPFKSSLILAPNLGEIAGGLLGWPLLAVVPDRDFLYLWDARHTEFIGRVGGVVLKNYAEAAYPVSTEVYEIGDDGIRATGWFGENQ